MDGSNRRSLRDHAQRNRWLQFESTKMGNITPYFDQRLFGNQVASVRAIEGLGRIDASTP
jgi:hypothetical protein